MGVLVTLSTQFSTMVAFTVTLICFAATIGAVFTVRPTYDCPAPVSPPNGQAFLYEKGNFVKYACNPGFKLVGIQFARCENNEWTPAPPVCLEMEADHVPPEVTGSTKTDHVTIPPPTRPLFDWDNTATENDARVNTTSEDDELPLSDEARLHMLLYPDSRYAYHRPAVITSRVRPARVESATELEEEEKKRSSKEEKTTTTVKVDAPSVVYVRRGLTSGKASAQLGNRALHMIVDNNGVHNGLEVVTVPRAAVSSDDKGEQADETLRHLYWMAHHNWYPHHAALLQSADGNPVVYTLSESQIAWINSLHPELRDRYLKDLYTTRLKEAEEAARAQAFLRRYEDAYSVFYNRPYYVRQPVAVVMEDPISTYDYSCFATDNSGKAQLIKAPRLANAYVYRYDRRQNPNHPRNDYLTAEYRCKAGYVFLDPRYNELHCRQRQWVGVQPICVPRG